MRHPRFCTQEQVSRYFARFDAIGSLATSCSSALRREAPMPRQTGLRRPAPATSVGAGFHEEIRMTAFLRRLAATCGLVIMGLAAGAAGAQQAAAAAQAATEDAAPRRVLRGSVPAKPEGQPDLPGPARHEGSGLRQVGRLLRQGSQSPERTEQERPRQAPLRVQVRRALERDEGQLPDLRVATGVRGRDLPVALP